MAKQNSVTIRYGAHVMSQHLGLTIVAVAPHSGA